MKLFEIQTILDATILTGEDQLDRTVVGAGGGFNGGCVVCRGQRDGAAYRPDDRTGPANGQSRRGGGSGFCQMF